MILGGRAEEKMCEYFLGVAEAREHIDKKIRLLKQVLDKRRFELNWRLDSVNSGIDCQTQSAVIRVGWVDSELRQLMRSVGEVEIETQAKETPVHTVKKDSLFRFWGVEKVKSDSDYMTMKRQPKRSASFTDSTKAPNFPDLPVSRESMNWELDEVTSPVSKSPVNSFFPSDATECVADTQRPRKKGSIAKWKSVELLSDPIYEVIDEKNLAGLKKLAWKKKPESKRDTVVFDLPLVARCPQGKKLGQLDRPKGVAVGSKGRIFVAEKGNNRVQVFDRNANYIASFGERSGANKMVGPYGVFVREETVYVTLTNQHSIQIYTTQGVFVREKGRQGREEGKLKSPTGIHGDDLRGKVFVCDTGNNRVQIFDKDLKFIKVVRTTQLDRPLDIKVVKLGDFFVLDKSQACLHLFNCFGELLRDVIDASYHLRLINPLFFTISPDGDFILSDFSSHCVHVFGSNGAILWTLGEGGKGKPLEEPRGLACDTDGRLVTVSNKKQDSLQIFKL